MSFPRYPKYRDSGTKWLGAVPAHWQVLPCRAIVRERTAKNEGAACTDYLSLMANVGIIPYAEKGDVGNKKPEDVSKCKIVTRGDFVINSMNYGIGSYGLSDYDGVCSPVYIVLKPQNDIVESRFAFRIFENRAFQTFAQSFGNGILDHRCAINWDILKGIGVGVPPPNEQKAILAFLDRETTKIDELVAEQQRLIELLQEKRQTVISRAVTKGLNPGAQMTLSGIEWLGEIPEHWTLARLSIFFRQVKRQEQIAKPVLSVYRDYGVILKDSRDDNLNKTPEDLSAYQLVTPQDLVVNKMKAWQGSLGVSDLEGITSPDYIVFTPRHQECSDFLHLLLRSKPLVSVYRSISNGIRPSQWRLEPDLFLGLRIPVPPLQEQHDVVAYINEQTVHFDSLTADAQASIELLLERRAALISAAVSGQIDVRDLVESILA